MKIREIYQTAIGEAMAVDWRGRECLDGILQKAKDDSQNPGFDEDRLFNPYGDTRIAYGDLDVEVESVLVGINITSVEVMLAAQMRQIGKKIDLCLSHHPSCINPGMYCLDDILVMHKDSLAEIGVDENVYGPIIDEWIATVAQNRVWNPSTVNCARNLDMPLMNIHTPCDLLQVANTRKIFHEMSESSLAEIAKELNNIEEIKSHPVDSVVVHGDSTRKPGKVYNPVGEGFRPLIELFKIACDAGIDTVVMVAATEEYIRMAQEYNVSIVELPHDSNDNFGINLMLDKLQKKGASLKIYSAERYMRISRQF